MQRSALPSTSTGWMKPSRPAVRSGETSAGQRREEAAGEAERVHHDALGPAGMDGDPADLQHGGVGGKRLVIDLAEILAVERVADVGGEFLRARAWSCPRAISSSGLKHTRMTPCGISGWRSRWRTALMTTATPALSSAPSRVVPLAVTMSWPIFSRRCGMVSTVSCCVGSSGSTIGLPSYLRCTIGLAPPGSSVAVSTWANQATRGTPALGAVAGIVAST